MGCCMCVEAAEALFLSGVATLLHPMCPYVLATIQSPLTSVRVEKGLLEQCF